MLNKNADAFASDLQFEIPENWCWCRLGEIAFITKLAGFEYSKKIEPNLVKDGIPLFKGKNVRNSKIIYKFEGFIPESVSDELSRSQVNKKCILTPYVGTIGNIGIHDKPGKYHLGSNVGKIELYELGITTEEFIVYYLKSSYGYLQLTKQMKATAQESISMEALRNVDLPLPPLPEQKRIVSAIEKAFAQIDIIEKNKLNLKTYIKQTKSKVLDLAIRGKLVEQNAEDGNAFDLLQKIRDEKEHADLFAANAAHPLKKANAVRREQICVLNKNADAFASDLQFEIPENWCWCKGKSIFLPMTSRTPSGSDFKYIDIETVDNKLQKIHYPKILKTENAPSRASRETLVGDTIFSMVRPYLKNIALITEDLSDCIASTGFFICRPNKALDSKYLYYLMISNYVVNGLNQFMKGDNSPSINGDDITEFYFPLPPLPEQKRIAAKIEQVFEQLDMLEKSLGE